MSCLVLNKCRFLDSQSQSLNEGSESSLSLMEGHVEVARALLQFRRTNAEGVEAATLLETRLE